MRRLLGLLVFVTVSLQAATSTLLPQAVRGSLAFGHVGDPNPTPIHVNAGVPANSGNYNFTITSSVWPTTPGLTMRIIIERSFDGGATWGFMAGSNPHDVNDHFVSAGSTKDGSGLIKFGTVWNGEALDIRGTATVNQPFSWGLDVSF